jgi:hypothetical protein
MLRGIALIVVAVVLGVVLLNATDSPEPFVPKVTAADGVTTTSTTEAPDGTASTTATTAVATAHKPGDVTVLVVNGSGVKGAAGRVATTVASEGYKLKPPGNTNNPAAASNVYYQAGYEADARAIAAKLTPAPGVQPMPDPAPVKDLLGANVLVVVAADLAK